MSTSVYSEDWCKKGSATCTATDPYSDGYSSGLPVVQGTDYLIAASSTIPGPNQKFTIACEPLTAPLPANDECSAAIPIGDGELTFNNTFATNAQVRIQLSLVQLKSSTCSTQVKCHCQIRL